MSNTDRKQHLLELVKKASDEEMRNIKRARLNALRALKGAKLEPYGNDALLELVKEINAM